MVPISQSHSWSRLGTGKHGLVPVPRPSVLGHELGNKAMEEMWFAGCLFIYAGVVERLKVIFDETKAPLTDDVSELPHFCVTLEGVLRHQQKGELP